MIELKKCKHCGKKFEPKNQQQMYCCEQCRLTHKRTYDKEYHEQRKSYVKECRIRKQKEAEEAKRKKLANTMPLYEIQRLAESAGMSYGQYMAVIKMRKMRGEI